MSPDTPALQAAKGLSNAEAARRLAEHGPNRLPGSQAKPWLTIALGVVTEPMFLMLLTAGGIYFALGDRAEALFLLGSVGVIIAITLAQERKTQRALESLRDLSAPRALVIRDGQEQRIAGHEVVPGDWLVLREGDRIAADAQLREGQLEVDESLLTGESVPVARQPASDDSPDAQHAATVSASTLVTRGVALAEVTATSAHTAVGRIGADLLRTAEPPSALQVASRHLVRRLALAALVLAVVQVLLGWWWNGQPLLTSLLSGVALAMAILPEEIPVILTVFLALGAWRLSRQQVLTRRVTAVEALGAITVLAVDKTGTLTQNRMAVVELATPDAHFSDAGAQALPEPFHRLVEFAMLATPGDPFDPMEKAIQAFGHRWLQGTEHVHDGREPEFEYPLSTDILAMTRVYASADPSQHLLATKGAPEAVADLCHLSPERLQAVRAQVQLMAERGLRVLGVAQGRWLDAPPPDWPASQHDHQFEFLGLVGLADPPRPEVPAAIAECRRAGVRVVMMTGDHPVTARAIAQQVGLSERPALITGADMDALDDAALTQRLREVDLCARLKPHHKLRLVQCLRASGEVVAMTGDGVNDAPALKAADVGVAMGERGTDVAREAAALVLLDDSFARIVAAVRQGRRIDQNIRQATRFVFAVHVPVIALALLPPLLHWAPLLLPMHIVLLELLIDPACSVVFEDEPEDPHTMQRPPRPVGESPFAAAALALPIVQGLGVTAVLLGGHALLQASAWPEAAARGVVFGTLVVSVLGLILANRQRWLAPNRWLARLALGMAALLVAVYGVPVLRELMGLAWPRAVDLLALGGMVGAVAAWLAGLTALGRWLGKHRSPGQGRPAYTGSP